ncbi:ADP-heptose:LPS heptosyltransferase [Chitinophaga sp. W3I9]|uniref:glycosyltransferase family 9 protein n=1 Tax=unclassified Chitinophaga TaxID=2619133 RepID=UPI003D210D55
MKRKIIRVISWGGLGDVLLTTPSFEALKKKDPTCKVIIYCTSKSHMEVYKNNPYIDDVRSNAFRSNMLAYFLSYFKLARFLIPNYGQMLPSLFFKKHATEIIAEEIFNVKLERNKVQIYLTGAEEEWAKQKLSAYRTPVAIHVTSITSTNQMWPLEYWEELVASSPEYTFLQLGLPSEQSIKGAVDLRGDTTFRQALGILKYSASFIGVVSSFLHASSAFDTPGIGLYGSSTPVVWGYDNNINLFKKLHCAPCIDYIWKSPCPYSSRCMTGITVAEVKAALDKQIRNRQQTRNPLESLLQVSEP